MVNEKISHFILETEKSHSSCVCVMIVLKINSSYSISIFFDVSLKEANHRAFDGPSWEVVVSSSGVMERVGNILVILSSFSRDNLIVYGSRVFQALVPLTLKPVSTSCSEKSRAPGRRNRSQVSLASRPGGSPDVP